MKYRKSNDARATKVCASLCTNARQLHFPWVHHGNAFLIFCFVAFLLFFFRTVIKIAFCMHSSYLMFEALTVSHPVQSVAFANAQYEHASSEHYGFRILANGKLQYHYSFGCLLSNNCFLTFLCNVMYILQTSCLQPFHPHTFFSIALPFNLQLGCRYFATSHHRPIGYVIFKWIVIRSALINLLQDWNWKISRCILWCSGGRMLLFLLENFFNVFVSLLCLVFDVACALYAM